MLSSPAHRLSCLERHHCQSQPCRPPAFQCQYRRSTAASRSYFSVSQQRRCRLSSVRVRSTADSSATSPDVQLQRPPKRNVNWGELKRLKESGEHVSVEVESVNRSGATFVLCGVDGFIPYSLMDFKHLMGDKPGSAAEAPYEYLVNKTFSLQLTEVDEEQNKLIGSEQAILFSQFVESMKEGDVVEGVVSRCADFGAFVKLGAGKSFRGVQGLIHISELSWNKIFIPEAVVKVGDFVRCKVLSVNKQKGQISLSLKQMEPDPLLERLDTVLGEDSEQLGFVPTELPPALEDILEALQKQPGVEGITLGRQAEERAVSQDLEIWISTSELDNGYGLVLRAGRLVQEITITSSLSKEELREMTQKVLKEVK